VGLVLAQGAVKPVGVCTLIEALDLVLCLLRALQYVEICSFYGGVVLTQVLRDALPVEVQLRLDLCMASAVM
jgi:hypothetical protein